MISCDEGASQKEMHTDSLQETKDTLNAAKIQELLLAESNKNDVYEGYVGLDIHKNYFYSVDSGYEVTFLLKSAENNVNMNLLKSNFAEKDKDKKKFKNKNKVYTSISSKDSFSMTLKENSDFEIIIKHRAKSSKDTLASFFLEISKSPLTR